MTIREQYGTSELERDFGRLTFGNALASYRMGEEKSQRAFAVFLGISPQSLCDIEKERRIPSPGRAAKIARQLGEPESFWVQLALQDMLRKENLNLVVSILAEDYLAQEAKQGKRADFEKVLKAVPHVKPAKHDRI